MRALLTITCAAVILWCGYWFIGSSQIESRATGALAVLRADGVTDSEDLRVSGFPSRFDMTVTPATLRDPGGAWSWRAPFLQIFTMSWKPNDIIAVWPHDQVLTIAGSDIAITTSDMRASASFGISASVPLTSSALVAKEITAAATGLTADEVRIATTAVDATGRVQRIGFEVSGFNPGDSVRGIIDPKGAMPARIDRIRLDARTEFDRPLNIHAAGITAQALDIADLSLTWGDVAVAGQGRLTLRTDGRPEGTLMIAISNWKGFLSHALNAGWINPRYGKVIEGMMATFEKPAAGGPPRIEVPLVFRGGNASLGPIPLGPAPVLRP